ncbi:MAG TPA: hypothetical protein VFY92_04000 [Hyphomicrobiaceae bacterium]|nr:hypothetical protein [Hyphomicrobiaceae bacterium]
MLEALLASGGLGVLLGLRYRIPAALVASVGVAIAGVVLAWFINASAWTVLTIPVGAVVALQLGYLGGLLLFHAASRAGLRRSG